MDTIHLYVSNKITCKRGKWHIFNTECVHLIEFFNKNVSKMYQRCNANSVSDPQKTFPPSINAIISIACNISSLVTWGGYLLSDMVYHYFEINRSISVPEK